MFWLKNIIIFVSKGKVVFVSWNKEIKLGNTNVSINISKKIVNTKTIAG